MYVTKPNHFSKRQIVYNELNLALFVFPLLRYSNLDTIWLLIRIAFYVGNIVECHDTNSLDEVNGQRLTLTKVGVVHNKTEEK